MGNLQTEKLIHIVLSTSRQGLLGWWNVSSPYLAQADFGIPGVAGDVNAVWEMLLAVCIMDCAIHVINRLLKRLQALCCWVISNNALNTMGNDRANWSCHRLTVFYLKIFQLCFFFFVFLVYITDIYSSRHQTGTAVHYVSVGRRKLCPADSVVKARQELGAGHSLLDGELGSSGLLCKMICGRHWSQPPKLVFCAPNGAPLCWRLFKNTCQWNRAHRPPWLRAHS